MNNEKINKINVKKKIAAGVSILSNISLIVLKLVVGLVSGSISIISEALHSLCDLFAAAIACFSVIKSSEPADDEHQFGHGKYEDLAGFIEAILIILTAVYIIYIAVNKLLKFGAEAHFETNLGISIMIVSVVLNFFVSRYLFKVAKKTDSIALLSDAEHLSTDVYSSLGILLGLVAIKYTGLYILDPVIAIVVAVIILNTGIKLTKQASMSLLDASLPKKDREAIRNALSEFEDRGLVGVKSVKTSKSGSRRVIQLVIFLPCNMTLKEAHILCDDIESRIETMFEDVSMIIHAEPNCENKDRKKCTSCEGKASEKLCH